MHNHYFALPGDLTLSFQTACDIQNEATRLQLGAYIPGLKIIDGTISDPDLTIKHTISDQSTLTCDSDVIEISTQKSNELPADLYHLIYGIVRKKLSSQGLFCVHAACVGHDDHYTLIAGHSGSGKTTLAHNLIFAHDMKLFSGNKTVIRFTENNTIEAIAGTSTMTALDGDRKRYAYEMPKERYADKDSVPIRSTALIRINDGVEECDTVELLSALHTLYPLFMDSVNSDVIVEGQHLYNGSSNEKDKKFLIDRLSQALKTMPVKKMSGTPQFLQQQLKLG